MKKLIILFILLFVFYIGLQGIFNIFSKGYETTYKLDNFEVYEKRVQNVKGETDNYYFEIKKDDLMYSIQTSESIAKSQKVLKEIKYFEDKNYKCILPISKNDKAISNVMCEKDGMFYYFDYIEGEDTILDEFAYENDKYLKNYNNMEEDVEILKNDSTITAYDNFDDNLYIGAENYKGVYLLNKKFGMVNVNLFEKDTYIKELSAFVKQYYMVADYNDEYETHNFYLIDLKTQKQEKITSDNKISLYSYVQGVVDNSVYILDPTNKVQYELNVKTFTITVVGDESRDIKIYNDGEWSNVSIYEAINNKLYFNTYDKIFNGKEYAKVDKIGSTLSGYYYLYEKVGEKYNVYRANVQNPDSLALIFETDNINNTVYYKDNVLYIDGNYLKYFGNSFGNRILAKYDEMNFNPNIKFGIKR
mgnify:CR=1 FL=1